MGKNERMRRLYAHHLGREERVLASVRGTVDTGRGEPWTGLLLATDRRLVFIGHDEASYLPYSAIESVGRGKSLLGAYVSLHTRGHDRARQVDQLAARAAVRAHGASRRARGPAQAALALGCTPHRVSSKPAYLSEGYLPDPGRDVSAAFDRLSRARSVWGPHRAHRVGVTVPARPHVTVSPRGMRMRLGRYRPEGGSMHIRTKARGWLAGVAAFTLLAVGTAQAAGDRTVEPLNQYAVSGRVTTDLLARAGYDLNEVKAIGKTGKLGIVATPAQAQALRDKGATVVALTHARTMSAPSGPLTDPVHGYDVFRPWSLKPAPCPGTCSTPNVPLKKWYHDLASRYPELVKEETIGQSILGQPIKAFKLTARCALHARRLPPGRRSSSRPSTPASGSPPRSTGACSPGSSTTGPTATSSGCSSRTRSGSSR